VQANSGAASDTTPSLHSAHFGLRGGAGAAEAAAAGAGAGAAEAADAGAGAAGVGGIAGGLGRDEMRPDDAADAAAGAAPDAASGTTTTSEASSMVVASVLLTPQRSDLRDATSWMRPYLECCSYKARAIEEEKNLFSFSHRSSRHTHIFARANIKHKSSSGVRSPGLATGVLLVTL
jgi:hypothetical protein